jgi:hypothetical protein
LWDRAVWSGCLFLYDEQGPPGLALVFRDADASEQIFEGWLKRLGKTDRFEELRVAIIEGNLPNRPAGGYTVHIGSNLDNIARRADEEGIDLPRPYFMTVSRHHYMAPKEGSSNLSFFKARFRKFVTYQLLPAVCKDDSMRYSEGLSIYKRSIEFRHLADIVSPDDMDSFLVPELRRSR